jgi:hypothetical protein
VSLAAQAYHLEDRKPGLEGIHWTSSLDGSLGMGARILATLIPGQHRITATMKDVTSDVTVMVDSLPAPQKSARAVGRTSRRRNLNQ